jgi:hypothetical protein
MFFKLSYVSGGSHVVDMSLICSALVSALAALVPLVASLTLEAPENPTTQGMVTIKW